MFKENFTRICMEKGLSPCAVCEAVGINKSNYSNWTNGSTPRKTTLMKLSDYLHVPVSELLADREPENNLQFFDNLEALCASRGITPTSLANQLGISTSCVSGWRHGASPRFDAMEKIAAYFGITVSELLADREPEVDLQLFASTQPTLTDDELALIRAYREDPNLRAAIDAMLTATGHKKTDAAASLIS